MSDQLIPPVAAVPTPPVATVPPVAPVKAPVELPVAATVANNSAPPLNIKEISIPELPKEELNVSKASPVIEKSSGGVLRWAFGDLMEFLQGVDNENSVKRLGFVVLVGYLIYLTGTTHKFALNKGDITNALEIIDLFKNLIVVFIVTIWGDRAFHKLSNVKLFKK